MSLHSHLLQQIVSAICEDVPLFLAGGFIVSWYLYRLIEDMVKLCLQYRQVDIDQVEWLNKIKIRLKIKKVYSVKYIVYRKDKRISNCQKTV